MALRTANVAFDLPFCRLRKKLGQKLAEISTLIRCLARSVLLAISADAQKATIAVYSDSKHASRVN